MTHAHAIANKALDDLNAEIQLHESELRKLHGLRAGRVKWRDDDSADHGWCAICGRVPVDPSQGFDTCENCRALE